MNRRNSKYFIGAGLIILIILGIFISVGSENMTYYHTPSEILQNPVEFQTKKIRLMGFVEPESVKWIPRETKLLFSISDEADTILPVEYIGSKPDMFREGQGVVVEGTLTHPKLFTAANLLVKHNEEYKVKKHGATKEDYYRTME